MSLLIDHDHFFFGQTLICFFFFCITIILSAKCLSLVRTLDGTIHARQYRPQIATTHTRGHFCRHLTMQRQRVFRTPTAFNHPVGVNPANSRKQRHPSCRKTARWIRRNTTARSCQCHIHQNQEPQSQIHLSSSELLQALDTAHLGGISLPHHLKPLCARNAKVTSQVCLNWRPTFCPLCETLSIE